MSIEGVQRIERHPVPEAAPREALLNALAHKDYANAAPIQISVYDDRVLLWNNGELHPGWTVEMLAVKHASQPFNPDIAHALFLAGLIEAWGSGYDRMKQACRAANNPPPHCWVEAGGIWLALQFALADSVVATKGPTAAAYAPEALALRPEMRPEMRPESTLAERVVDLLSLGPLAMTELAAALGHATVSGELQKQVRRLRRLGKVELTLPATPNSGRQKYRLTDLGRATRVESGHLVDGEEPAEHEMKGVD